MYLGASDFWRPSALSGGPSLDLNLLGGLDSRITFSRTSTATYFDSAGTMQTAAASTPRFDYDPVTKQALGLLIEEARTNLHPYSQDLNLWANTGGYVTANTTVAPDGTMTADTVTMGADGSLPGQGVVYSAGVAHTVSIYIKDGAVSPFLRVRIATAASSVSGYFNLSSFTAGSLGTGMTGGRVDDCGGYRRYSFQYTPAAGDEGSRSTTFAGVTANNSGTGTGSFVAWGAQVEVGAFPSSYIPTAGSSVTRAADVASMPLGSWFNASLGTLLAETAQFATGSSSGQQMAAELGDGSINNLMQIGTQFASTNFQTLVNVGGVAQALNLEAAIAGSIQRRALAYNANDFAMVRNGGTVATDTSGTVPTVTTLYIGNRASIGQLNGYVRRIRYWPTRKSNAELQGLTS